MQNNLEFQAELKSTSQFWFNPTDCHFSRVITTNVSPG